MSVKYLIKFSISLDIPEEMWYCVVLKKGA